MINKLQITSLYRSVYGDDSHIDALFERIEHYKQQYSPLHTHSWSERDVLMISYGNSILKAGENPLETLYQFMVNELDGVISGIHILPCFPFSSDDGFSVIDYRQIDYKLGDWQHINQIAGRFDLMLDLVLNHVSRQHLWFIDFVAGDGPGQNYFIESDPHGDYSQVVRPRTSPLIVDAYTREGIKHIWATFSSDQVDVNFQNPVVLLEYVDILLGYIVNGAKYIRLDAVAFLWKQAQTSCIHLPQTHTVIKLLREVMLALDPHLAVITETNVPHEENVSYFGEGDEAHMVYNFALPPLLLHGLNRGNASFLTRWARYLDEPPKGCTFFNFVASHDGIGLRAVEGIIPPHEIDDLIRSVHEFGGFVSMKANGDGTRSPYELNISLFEALQGTRSGPDIYQFERFLCCHMIMLAFKGVPAIYIHSLLATENDLERVEQTGRTRSINRHKWIFDELTLKLTDEKSHHHRVFEQMKRLIQIRTAQTAFHPDSEQAVMVLSDTVFALVRTAQDKRSQILALHNMTAYPQEVCAQEKLPMCFRLPRLDLVSNEVVDLKGLQLLPYQCLWLVSDDETCIQNSDIDTQTA